MIRLPFPPHGVQAKRTRTAAFTVFTLIGLAWFFRDLLCTTWTLAALRVRWRDGADQFILSKAHDDFDITFLDYDKYQLSAAPDEDLVPPILHHIDFGQPSRQWDDIWGTAVQSCIDLHPGWETHTWTEKKAVQFVAEKYPDLLETWENYPYLIERVDALRYMVLYEYGGVVLDMDLKCKRALGPLRRFQFVAVEAQPTGFSIGFMMAKRHNTFVSDILRNLNVYDRQWLGLPYPTVMFSTGCHFASVIHARQANRTALKVLPAPMHSLNGRVTTPIFDHLGSSSWHSYDARLMTSLGRRTNLLFVFVIGVAATLCVARRMILRWLCCQPYATTVGNTLFSRFLDVLSSGENYE
ncbi:glycosyltransferase family 32 protein [Purpureocillium lilacinum]|uniref:Glycosyltransferase family 32 protein n=1 Tax=Purpureocillium lilacinum TaxID=33203 RepID=A0A179G218_PURLI|nr:glycosyltransferase family 32 protein [Purpureocillium lilacinum]OAQ71882.1 glycosyltransferase family 32 protein [Purpureocillium lilacinum]